MSRYHDTIANLLAQDLKPGDVFRLQVTSDSMRPVLQPGDHVVAQVVPAKSLQRGDLLVIQRSHDFVTHRLVNEQAGNWLLKADNDTQTDPVVQTEQIIGRIIEIERRGRRRQLHQPIRRIGQQILGWCSWMEIKAVKYGRISSLPWRALSYLLRQAMQ